MASQSDVARSRRAIACDVTAAPAQPRPNLRCRKQLDAQQLIVGRFRYFLHGRRWQWSDEVARMHGYQPGEVQPTTELLLQHSHRDDRARVAAVLVEVSRGEPFRSRHRIIDTAGRTHCVVVVGDTMCDRNGAVTGNAGFYVDVTEPLQADVSTALSNAAASRCRIEQAKGVLMAAHGISADRAFDILAWRSQEANIKLRDLAARFLTAIAGRVSSGTLANVDNALLTIE